MPCDVTPERRAVHVGGAEVEPGEDAGQLDVPHRLVEMLVPARRTGHGAVERDLGPTGTDEFTQRLRDRAGVTRVRRGVLGEVRRRAQRPPPRIRFGRRIPVGVGPRDGGGRPPEHVVVLGVEAGDHRVAAADVGHRQHPRRPDQVEPPVGGQAQHALVPLTQVMIGPEERVDRLAAGSRRAREPAQPLHLVKVRRIRRTRQGRRAVRTKLPGTVERERPDP